MRTKENFTAHDGQRGCDGGVIDANRIEIVDDLQDAVWEDTDKEKMMNLLRCFHARSALQLP
jgi:hypothetical protein